jgi:hypothetical protein
MEDYLKEKCYQIIHKKNLTQENYVITYFIEFSCVSKIIKNWKYNRPHCPIRVSEIEKLIEANEWIPPELHVMKYMDMNNNILYCFDGNNRRKAIKNYLKSNPKLSFPVILHTFYNANDSLIRKHFSNINKSISVSELYLCHDENEQNLKNKIKEYVDIFTKKYSGLMSPSKICQKPNYQKDIFEQNIYDIYLALDKSVKIEEIFRLLETLNQEIKIKEFFNQNTNQTIYEKCKKNDMFLFYYGRTLQVNLIKSLLLSHNK